MQTLEQTPGVKEQPIRRTLEELQNLHGYKNYLQAEIMARMNIKNTQPPVQSEVHVL